MTLESGWTKYFNDGLSEVGSDDDVSAHKASWQCGRLEGLVSVKLQHRDTAVILKASEGNWWQSDSMVSTLRGYGNVGDTTFVTRRIEYQIVEGDIDKFVCLDSRYNKITVVVDSNLPAPSNREREAIKLSHLHVGKWLYVSLDIQSNMVTISIHDEKK